MPGKYSIAIDGPAGAGKSTVARGVARALGYRYVDTGAMYRAVTLKALDQNVDLDDGEALTGLAINTTIDIIEDKGKNITVLMDGRDVSEGIRDPRVSRNVSRVARVEGVRRVLADAQSVMAASGGVVMEGRDIGTVVIPQADFKFYIVASPLERARRRARELEAKGHQVNLEELAGEIEARDFMDSSREVNPLRPAGDAVFIDCSEMTAEEVVSFIVKRVTEGRA